MLIQFQITFKQFLLNVLFKISSVIAENVSGCTVLLIDKLLLGIVYYLLKAVFVFLAFSMLFLLLLIVFLVTVICLFFVFAVLFILLIEIQNLSNTLFESILFKHMMLIAAMISSIVLTISSATLAKSYQAFLIGSKKKIYST